MLNPSLSEQAVCRTRITTKSHEREQAYCAEEYKEIGEEEEDPSRIKFNQGVWGRSNTGNYCYLCRVLPALSGRKS